MELAILFALKPQGVTSAIVGGKNAMQMSCHIQASNLPPIDDAKSKK